MKNLIRLSVAVTFLGLILPIALDAQEQNRSPLKKFVTIDPLFNANIWSAVHVLADQGIPIGFEGSEHWNVDMGPRLWLKSGQLVDVLNSISEQDPSYSWKEADGVINIFPTIWRDAKIASFLQTRIGPLTVAKGDDRASTVERIGKLFNGGIEKEIQFVSMIGAGNDLGLADKYEEQLDIPACDTRTALNKLTKPQKYRPVWTVIRSEKDNVIIVVF